MLGRVSNLHASTIPASLIYCSTLPPPAASAAGAGSGIAQQSERGHRLLTAAAYQADSPTKHPTNRVAWSTRDAYKPAKLKAKRSLGQNFLQREEVLQAITEAAGVSPGDQVLEIGPGTGALTRHLLRAGASLTAVEKDDALYEQLQRDFEQVCQL